MERAEIQQLPKVELHNHLDGGLRVRTVLELAAEIGYRALPADDEADLAAWFYRDGAGSLEEYLAGFVHTVAVMQTAGGIERVAYEAGLDLHADNVIYGEIRFAPRLNTRGGLRREEAIEAALTGLHRAQRETGTVINLIVDAMRNEKDSLLDAVAAGRYSADGVVGFDLAGPEAGFPARDHRQACEYALENGLRLTIHAGEAVGPESIQDAIETCHAERIGHGIHIVDDIDPTTGELGAVATEVFDRQVPLEVCPTSNLHTLDIQPADHPVGALVRAGFNVTLNTDNRLMSNVTLTDEMHNAVTHHQFEKSDLRRLTLRAADAAFTTDEVKRKLREAIRVAYDS